MKKEELIDKEEKLVFEATRLIGRNSKYIRKNSRLQKIMKNSTMKTMMAKTINSKKSKYGRPIVTTRTRHYANTAMIAYKIAEGIFNKEPEFSGKEKEIEEFARGVAISALYHDLGQWPYGHDGDEAAKYASKEYNGGARLHNIEGRDKFRFRYAKEVIKEINSGKILEEESKKRGISIKKLEERIEIGLEPEVAEKIEKETKNNSQLTKKAIQIIEMSIANHNGERGTANIVPNYLRTYEEFDIDSEKVYYDPREDKNMVSCNIVDAIVKISDQISSIPFDIIDAKRAGIEDEISDNWADPISKVLNISKEEAIKLLKGNNRELVKLAQNLQDKLIESIVKNSNKRKIDMDIAPFLYGKESPRGELLVAGLRTFNMTEHIAFTSNVKMEILLNNKVSELTELLVGKLLDENKTFYMELNELFRIPASNPVRKYKEKKTLTSMSDNPDLEDFYRYITETSAEEYLFNKKIVKKREVQHFKEIIKEVESKRNNIIQGIESRSPRKSTGYLVESYMLSPSYVSIEKNKEGDYSDTEIEKMLDRINAYLKVNPVEEIKHLSLSISKHKYIEGVDGAAEKISVGKRKINTDEQIASRLVIGFINELSDVQLVELMNKLKILSDEDKKVINEPYNSDKKEPYNTKASRIGSMNYKEAILEQPNDVHSL